VGRGDRRKVRWRNDRVRKKHEREKRRRQTAREPASGGESPAPDTGQQSSG
jgi:hypothetical protein